VLFRPNILARGFKRLKGDKGKILSLYKKNWLSCECVSKVVDYLYGNKKHEDYELLANPFPTLDPENEEK